MGVWVHRISNVDEKTGMADCANCGRVPTKYKSGRKLRVCKVAWMTRERKGGRTTGLGYGYREGDCAICGKHTDKLVQDHDHATDKLRDWLCRGCNLKVGLLETDVFSPQLDYIKRHTPRN